MSPFELARKVYRQKVAREFQADLRAHLIAERGVVIKTEEAFAMAHPVWLESPDVELFNWWDIDHEWPAEPNAWFVTFAAGNLRALMRELPKPLEYICFHRRHMRWRAIPTRRLIR